MKTRTLLALEGQNTIFKKACSLKQQQNYLVSKKGEPFVRVLQIFRVCEHRFRKSVALKIHHWPIINDSKGLPMLTQTYLNALEKHVSPTVWGSWVKGNDLQGHLMPFG